MLIATFDSHKHRFGSTQLLEAIRQSKIVSCFLLKHCAENEEFKYRTKIIWLCILTMYLGDRWSGQSVTAFFIDTKYNNNQKQRRKKWQLPSVGFI